MRNSTTATASPGGLRSIVDGPVAARTPADHAWDRLPQITPSGLLCNIAPRHYVHDITGVGPLQAAATSNGLFPTTPGYDLAILDYWGGHVVAGRDVLRDRDAEFSR